MEWMGQGANGEKGWFGVYLELDTVLNCATHCICCMQAFHDACVRTLHLYLLRDHDQSVTDFDLITSSDHEK